MRLNEEKEGSTMKESILTGRSILGVEVEPDILKVLEVPKEDVPDACPNFQFDGANFYETAVDMKEWM